VNWVCFSQVLLHLLPLVVAWVLVLLLLVCHLVPLLNHHYHH
jgi:hypothetical protein